MPTSRAVWSGYVRFSLVSIPVKAYTAHVSGGGGGGVALNQLHSVCNSRIRYIKTCPVHGEVKNDEIVSGYQFAEDQYVVIDTSELDKLRPRREKDIAIDAFVDAGTIDPARFSGKSYYLLPDDKVGAQPYALLARAMREQERVGVAQVVMFGREQLVALRPVGKLLMLSMLAYASDMKDPAEFERDAPEPQVSPEELKLAKSLTDALTEEDFDLAKYKDEYAERLTKLVEAKVKGQEVVAPPDEPAPRVINLMEALKKSIAESQKKKPAKLVAASPAAKSAAAARKRKSS